MAASTYARALFETFASHQRKENNYILLLLLVEEPSVSLTDLKSASHGHGHHH